jgi:hypothetical protein
VEVKNVLKKSSSLQQYSIKKIKKAESTQLADLLGTACGPPLRNTGSMQRPAFITFKRDLEIVSQTNVCEILEIFKL